MTDKCTYPGKFKLNGAVYVLVKNLRNVMGSAAKIEIGAPYENVTAAIPTQVVLIEMGDTQPPMPMQVDNNKAVNFENGELKQKRTKAIGVSFIG